MTAMRYYERTAGLFVVITCAAVFAGCADTGRSANDTLPPILTTTSTTTLPETTTTIPKTYVIQSGDSLSEIAKLFGVSAAALAAFNNITDPDKIEAGQVISLPQPGATAPTTTPTTPTAPKATIAAAVPTATTTAAP
jgi:LysM repeat protein